MAATWSPADPESPHKKEEGSNRLDSESPLDLEYQENPKHKRGCVGQGPPRWFPSVDSLCPDDLTRSDAQELLLSSVEGRDSAHPNRRARIAVDDRGRFFKAYSSDGGRTWHGYPVRRDLVHLEIPSKVLREFVKSGRQTKAQFKKLLGSA